MSKTWDKEVDFLVAGTGAAALSTAIGATKEGLSNLIVEGSSKWGGTTLYSGGGVWIPNNHLMRKDGENESPEAALDYIAEVVEYDGPASSETRRKAAVYNGSRMVEELEGMGVKWMRCKNTPDYHPNPGSRVGRSIEVKPFNVKKLKGFYNQSRVKEKGMPLPVTTSDVEYLSRPFSSFSGFWQGVRLVFRTLSAVVTLRKRRGMGGGLVASLMYILQQRGVPVELSTPIKKLIVENGVVVGAEVEKDGKTFRYGARKGVFLGTGGFAHNPEWRQKYQGISGWSTANPDDIGTGIAIGQEVGGAVELMDDAWWGASTPHPNVANTGDFFVWERSMPHSIIVDSSGKRYLNESESYVDLGHHMFERDTTVSAIPSWLVADKKHTRRYLFTPLLNPYAKDMKANGSMVEAQTLAELAEKIGVPVAALQQTVEKFNEYARTGKDLDFGRDDTVYDRYYSDPWCKPNPNLGTLEKGPFLAFKIVPGDLGTKGGLVTDKHGRVQREDGSVIESLYAGGNTTASVYGRRYPGPGATLGPAVTFGYLAGEHAASKSA